MNIAEIADWVGAVLLLLGSMLAVIAGLGALRLPDLLARMHAATKPQVLGLMLLMTGLALTLRSTAMTFALVLVVAFQLITSPISAHMLGRAGYRTGKVEASLMVVDELTTDLDRAEKLDRLERLEAERAEQQHAAFGEGAGDDVGGDAALPEDARAVGEASRPLSDNDD